MVMSVLRQAAIVCGMLSCMVFSIPSVAQTFSPNSVLRVDGNIATVPVDTKLPDLPMQNQQEFWLRVDLSDEVCGLSGPYLEKSVLDMMKSAPFKISKERLHSAIIIEIDAALVDGKCLSQIHTSAEYEINMELPGQTRPWFARIPLWVNSDDTNWAAPSKHRADVNAVLQNHIGNLISYWEYENP
jgi:hypothetical protein